MAAIAHGHVVSCGGSTRSPWKGALRADCGRVRQANGEWRVKALPLRAESNKFGRGSLASQIGGPNWFLPRPRVHTCSHRGKLWGQARDQTLKKKTHAKLPLTDVGPCAYLLSVTTPTGRPVAHEGQVADDHHDHFLMDPRSTEKRTPRHLSAAQHPAYLAMAHVASTGRLWLVTVKEDSPDGVELAESEEASQTF